MPRKAAPRAPDPMVTPEELSEEIRIAVPTLYVWRHRGQGPKSFKVGQLVRYRRSEITRWLAEQGDTAQESA